jgi:hypothetical protein
MPFLRRGSGGEPEQPIEQRLEAFWSWWAGAKDSIAADIPRGTVSARAAEISAEVNKVHPSLAWELGKGASSEHAFVVSCEGNPELRPIALRWAAAAPPPDATWEYHPSRQPGPPQVLEIRGVRVPFSEMRAIASWDEARETLDVRLWHPAFEGLPTEVKAQVSFLFLDNLVGEDDVERWIGAIDADPEGQSGMSADELRDEIRGRAASSTGENWALIEGTDARGDPVLVRLNSSLKRIDHPYAGEHLQVTLDRGFDQGTPALTREIAAAEEELEAALRSVAVEAAHITDRRRRVTHFVTAEGERARGIAEEWAGRYGQWGPSVTLEPDPTWSFRKAYGG